VFDAATRTFSGAPAASGTFQITVTATDAAGASVSDTFALVVDDSWANLLIQAEAFTGLGPSPFFAQAAAAASGGS
jgi:hypothetical protein